jgi:hypothetical protein
MPLVGFWEEGKNSLPLDPPGQEILFHLKKAKLESSLYHC